MDFIAEVMAQSKPLPGKMQEAANNAQDTPSTPAVIGPTMTLVTGKSTLLRLDAPIDRVSVGNPAVADVTIISPRELYLLGKSFGSTNVILWSKGGPTTAIDVVINIDADLLQDSIAKLLPGEKDIRVTAAADSVVLSGVVSSAMQVQQAVAIADSYVRNINKGLVLPIVAGDGTAKAGTTITVGQPTGGSDRCGRSNRRRESDQSIAGVRTPAGDARSRGRRGLAHAARQARCSVQLDDHKRQLDLFHPHRISEQ